MPLGSCCRLPTSIQYTYGCSVSAAFLCKPAGHLKTFAAFEAPQLWVMGPSAYHRVRKTARRAFDSAFARAFGSGWAGFRQDVDLGSLEAVAGLVTAAASSGFVISRIKPDEHEEMRAKSANGATTMQDDDHMRRKSVREVGPWGSLSMHGSS